MGQLEDISKHQNMVRNNIMKSFGAETSEDSLEKSFEDEVNPFEMEAYKSELTKAELDEFEKAKHQDGDMHPNGKWVWRASANGGKGDWRVATSVSSSTFSSSDKKEKEKVGAKSQKKVTLKQIFEDIQGLNPSTSTISSIGTFVSNQNQQLADRKAKEIMDYLPKNSLAYKIISATNKFSDKQLWVIAYELEKNNKYKEALSDFLEEVERKEKLRREKVKTKKQAKAKQQKKIDEISRKNDTISVDDEVEHPKYGIGKVTSITDSVIKVSFADIGEKTFMKKFAPLNKK